MLPAALVPFLGFNVAMLACHMAAVPPQLFDPGCTKYFNRWVYLTYQSNVICTIYFGVSLVDDVLGDGALTPWLLMLFPLIFALGTFLTLAYYALDHFNPENFRRKERHKAQYPYVHWCSHLEHGHALPLVLLHGATVRLSPGAELPTSTDVARTVGVYYVFYLLWTHLNYSLTGLWQYPVINDVTRRGGIAMRIVFFAALGSLFIVFGVGGSALLHAR